ncbi:unnamed protein product [Gongylonema pulchrum]|uniref:Maelstrom domain-containing protein n=1 Tax=Gongylonema pulchrum TaxID=637853 RepID=A0A183EDM1_9BILA|nr:unnamed protein product [Gongylonema pulchrum]
MTRVERAVQAAAAVANKRKRQADRKKRLSLLQRYVEQTYYYEGYFGRHADLNICVTHAMRQDMRDAWDVSAATVYDKPPSWNFRKLNDEERHNFYVKLARYSEEFKTFRTDCSASSANGEFADGEEKLLETRFSYRDNDEKVHLRNDRPLILISSTSWTEDEDFGLLLDALRLDLPMKVVDMFGCALPVIVKRFACIGELVSDGYNGRLFDTAHELSHIIKTFACGFPLYSTVSLQQLNTLASNIQADPLISWSKNWDACMWPLVRNYGALSAEDLARRQR